jgi:hypothetical protein
MGKGARDEGEGEEAAAQAAEARSGRGGFQLAIDELDDVFDEP